MIKRAIPQNRTLGLVAEKHDEALQLLCKQAKHGSIAAQIELLEKYNLKIYTYQELAKINRYTANHPESSLDLIIKEVL